MYQETVNCPAREAATKTAKYSSVQTKWLDLLIFLLEELLNRVKNVFDQVGVLLGIAVDIAQLVSLHLIINVVPLHPAAQAATRNCPLSQRSFHALSQKHASQQGSLVLDSIGMLPQGYAEPSEAG